MRQINICDVECITKLKGSDPKSRHPLNNLHMTFDTYHAVFANGDVKELTVSEFEELSRILDYIRAIHNTQIYVS